MTIRGLKISAPIVSPTHHVNQLNGTLAHSTAPATQRLVTPMVALITQLRGPPKARNLKISASRTSGVGNPTNRRTRKAPTVACSAAPLPMTLPSNADFMIAHAELV